MGAWDIPDQSSTEPIQLESVTFRIHKISPGAGCVRNDGHIFCFPRRTATIAEGFNRDPKEKLFSRPGDYSVMPASTDYRAEFMSPVESITIEAPSSMFVGMAYETLPPERTEIPLVVAARDTIMEHAGRLVEAIALTPEHERCGIAIEQLLLGMARRAMSHIGVDPMRGDVPYRTGLPPVQLWRVREYIEANIDSQMTLGELAGVACLSVFHFTRAFGVSMGMSPMRYVWSRRVTRAKDIIRQKPTQSLAMVALECGFRSQTHFGEVFKRETGMTPGAYRRTLTT